MASPSVGMMTYSFNQMIRQGEIDVASVIRLCAAFGVESFDIGYGHWKDLDRDIAATIEALAETGTVCASSHSGLDLVTRTAEAKAERETELHALFGNLNSVGCPNAMLGSPTHDLSGEDWRREFGIGLAEAAEVAEQYGITVTFENRGGASGLMVGTAEHCLDILAHADDPRVRFTFDVGNFRYVGSDRDEAFDRLADSIAHVHLKDVVPKGESFTMVPLGEGEVDNAPTIRKLAARGYTGCLAIECGGHGCDAEDARASVEFVQRALAGH